MKRNVFYIILLVLLSGFAGIGVYQLTTGGVVISMNPDAKADPSAILDVQSTSRGILIPRMTTEQRNQIQNPAIGLEIFNLDKGNKEFFNGSFWESSTVPIGTIQPFAGDTSLIPKGWLLCDGRLIGIDSGSIYYDLYLRIGKSWGGDSVYFRIPDLRGLFLRGADLDAGVDPDANSRTALYSGGNSGQNVGSYQSDVFRSHNHSGTTNSSGYHRHKLPSSAISDGVGSGTVGYTWIQLGDRTPDWSWVTKYTDYAGSHTHSFTTNNTGGNETRPKNVYVNYIIKF